MKIMYNGTPIKSLNIKHHEISTNDCDMIASDLQVGKTAVAKGRKITGTGRSFEFAYYGDFETNDFMMIPCKINVVHLSSDAYPTQDIITLYDMKNLDFSTEQIIGNIIIDGVAYPVKVVSTDSKISISCDQTVALQVFFGKDNYV